MATPTAGKPGRIPSEHQEVRLAFDRTSSHTHQKLLNILPDNELFEVRGHDTGHYTLFAVSHIAFCIARSEEDLGEFLYPSFFPHGLRQSPRAAILRKSQGKD